MNNEEKDENLKKIILIIVSAIILLLIGILISESIKNSIDYSEENEIIEDKDDEEDNSNESFTDEDNNEKEDNDINEEENNLVDELIKKELYLKINNYVQIIDLFNKKYSCNSNVITEECIDDISKIKIIFSEMDSSSYSEPQYDEETSSMIYFVSFSTIRQYEKEIFGTNKLEFPDGEKIGNLFCDKYEKMEESYKVISMSSACSVNSNETGIWTFDREKLNNIYQNKDIIYVDIPYYYIYGNELSNWDESIKFCTDETREDCVEKMEKLDESKLKKARFTFDYTDNKLKFNYIEIFNTK